MYTTWPGYLSLLESGELARRALAAIETLADCTCCPRLCHADRRQDDSIRSYCRTGRMAIVSNAFPHHGEEDCLRGWGGSGTIFFSQCNLRCVFCQNFDTSWEGHGRPVTADQLADQMLRLQELGCHNINFVTPSHVVPQILEALVATAERGLRLPLVYNTGGYDRLETLQWLDGVVDIYMPDFKFWKPETAQAADYPEVAQVAIKEMHRQVVQGQPARGKRRFHLGTERRDARYTDDIRRHGCQSYGLGLLALQGHHQKTNRCRHSGRADRRHRRCRIRRQGNENEEVAVYRYVTEGSFDAYMWQALETKARFIGQVITGDNAARRAEDIGGQELSYAEVKAIASGILGVDFDQHIQFVIDALKPHAEELGIAGKR